MTRPSNVTYVTTTSGRDKKPSMKFTYVAPSYRITRTPTGVEVNPLKPSTEAPECPKNSFIVRPMFVPLRKRSDPRHEDKEIITVQRELVVTHSSEGFIGTVFPALEEFELPEDGFWDFTEKPLNASELLEACNALEYGVNREYYTAVCQKFMADYGTIIEPSSVKELLEDAGHDIYGRYAYVIHSDYNEKLLVSNPISHGIMINPKAIGIKLAPLVNIEEDPGTRTAAAVFKALPQYSTTSKSTGLVKGLLPAYTYHYTYRSDTRELNSFTGGDYAAQDTFAVKVMVWYPPEGETLHPNGFVSVIVTGIEYPDAVISKVLPYDTADHENISLNQWRTLLKYWVKSVVPDHDNAVQVYRNYYMTMDFNVRQREIGIEEMQLSYSDVHEIVEEFLPCRAKPGQRLLLGPDRDTWEFDILMGTFTVKSTAPGAEEDVAEGLTEEEAAELMGVPVPPVTYYVEIPVVAKHYIVEFNNDAVMAEPQLQLELGPEIKEPEEIVVEEPIQKKRTSFNLCWDNILFDVLGRDPVTELEAELVGWFVINTLRKFEPKTTLVRRFFRSSLSGVYVTLNLDSEMTYNEIIAPLVTLFKYHEISVDEMVSIVTPLQSIRVMNFAELDETHNAYKITRRHFNYGVNRLVARLYVRELQYTDPEFLWNDVAEVLEKFPQIPKRTYAPYIGGPVSLRVNVPQFLKLIESSDVSLADELYDLIATR